MSRRLRVVRADTFHRPPVPEPLEARASREAEVAKGAALAYERGLAEGRVRAEQACREREASFGRTIETLEARLAERLELVEREAVRAALHVGVEIAKRVLGREAALDPELAARTVRAALAGLPGATEVEVRLNPEDLEVLENPAGLREPGGAARLRFVADPSVEPGGAIVESDVGRIDARLEAQLQAASDFLFARDLEEKVRS